MLLPRPLRSRKLLALPASLLVLLLWLPAPSAKAATPFALTQAAGPVRSTTATLNGMVVPQDQPTSAWFEWGSARTYGFATPPVDLGSGTQTIRVSAPIGALSPGSVYHCRLVASNALGAVFGADQVFTTGMRMAMWGDTSSGGYASPMSGLTNLVGVACGHGHFLGVRNDGTVVAWGPATKYPNYGQTNVPAGLSNVIAVAGGYSHSLALKEDGSVVAWGKYSSQLPVTIPAELTNVIAVAAGDFHNLALKPDGTVVVWGDTSRAFFGQFSVPAGLSNVVAIACGSTFCIVLKADGTVTAWGNYTTDLSTVTSPAGLTNVVAIASASWRLAALRSNGTAVGWGVGTPPFDAPAGLRDVTALATGFKHSLAVTNGGKVVAWGYLSGLRPPPDLREVAAIACADYHSVALTPVDVAPLITSGTKTCPVDVDSILAPGAGASDPNGDPITFIVTALPAKGTLYQYTASGRGAPITSPGTRLTDTQGRVTFAPQPSASGSDFFRFSASDGELMAPTNSFSIYLTVPTPVLQPIGFVPGDTPGFAFSFSGVPNRDYQFLYTSDFKTWTWSSVFQSPTGQFTIIDPGAPGDARRFYRVYTP